MKTLDFKNPPVLEAVLDVSTICSDEESALSFIAKTNIEFIADFPNQKEINKFEGKLDISPESSAKTSHTKTLVGFSCSNEENQELIQRRVNGFSFHKLKPYYAEGGDEFIKNAISCWNKNVKALGGNALNSNKIGLRFINLIKLDNQNINKNFTVSVSNTDSIGNLKSIAYSYSVKLEDEYISNVNLYPGSNNEYILDIDIFKSFSPQPLTKKEIIRHFNFMRDKKNLIFEKTLKESVLEKYNPVTQKL